MALLTENLVASRKRGEEERKGEGQWPALFSSGNNSYDERIGGGRKRGGEEGGGEFVTYTDNFPGNGRKRGKKKGEGGEKQQKGLTDLRDRVVDGEGKGKRRERRRNDFPNLRR